MRFFSVVSLVGLIAIPLSITLQLPSAQAQQNNDDPRPKKLPTKTIPAPTNADPSGVKSTGGRVPLDPTKTIKLTYGLPQINKDPRLIENATILIREGKSGRIVQIQLEETAPDSGVFSGMYSVNFREIERLAPEIYIPPQDLMKNPLGMRKISQMIQNGELKRSPFILRRMKSGQQTVEIFDSRDQARIVMKTYRAEQQALELQNKKIVPDSALDAAALAEDLAEQKAALKAANERLAIEQSEAQKLADRIRQTGALTADERQARRTKAETLAAEGMQHYQASQFPEAKAKFEQAYELDPDNRTYLFQFGVILYKLDENNRSIVFLDMASGQNVNEVEKNYYIALNYVKIKDYPAALVYFRKVKDANDPNISSSGTFYIGIIYFEKRKFDDAQKSFQEVLDASTDPNMDKRAELYIEQILRIKQFEAERAKKWTLSGTLGAMYDSNVTLASDSARDQGTASNIEGYRLLQQLSTRYRPVYEANYEFATQFDLVNMYTVDKSFKFDQNLRNSDPLVATLTLPFTYKGTLLNKGYKLDLTPGFESIYMSVEENTTKEILNSYTLGTSNTFIMSDDWFTIGTLDLRKDNSKLTSSIGDNDSSAFKWKLGWSNLIFVSKEKTKIIMAGLGYTMNDANGKNVDFNRIDANVGYVSDFIWNLTYNVSLSYFKLEYPNNDTKRKDDSYTLGLGTSRKINDILSAGVNGSYNINNSTETANQYKKWTALLTLSGSFSF